MTSARDMLGVVEAAYRLDPPPSTWMTDVLHASRPLLDEGMGLLGCHFKVSLRGKVTLESSPTTMGDVPDGYDGVIKGLGESLTPTNVRETWAHPHALDTASAAFHRSGQPGTFEDFRLFDVSRAFGVLDNLVAKGVDASRHGFLVCSPLRQTRGVAPRERRRWRQVMTHVLAGLRLRETLRGSQDDGDAVLDSNFRVVHAEGSARSRSAREQLRESALRIDRARSRTGRAETDLALEAWQGLVSGKWSLVDRFERDGRRYLIARRNDPHTQQLRSLTSRERQIVGYAALGQSNKEIAYALGLAVSTVSSHLRTAMRRLGARNVDALAEIWQPEWFSEGDET